MKKILLAAMSFLLIILLAACSYADKNIEGQSPEQLLKSYFTALNSKDAEKLKPFTSEEKQLSANELNNIEYVKLSEIKALENDNRKYSYLRNKITSKDELQNIALYTVRFEIKYKDDSKSPIESGNKEWVYVLRKGTNSSQWKIIDWGDLQL